MHSDHFKKPSVDQIHLSFWFLNAFKFWFLASLLLDHETTPYGDTLAQLGGKVLYNIKGLIPFCYSFSTKQMETNEKYFNKEIK